VVAGEKSTSQENFNKLDKDQNGYISQQEAKANKKLLEQWDSADADSDGQLELSEFSAFESGKAPAFTPNEDSDEPGLGAAPMK
jgi:Ca2+-binding EF-hand superfamily protein